MDPYMYQRQFSNGSNDGCFYEGTGGEAPELPGLNPRGRRTSSDASARSGPGVPGGPARQHGGSGSYSTDDEAERPHATGPAPFRSTKGASKQRRDLINGEIGNLRDMLPLPESARQRLSQLQIMSLACCYIRKCNYFARLFGDSVYATGAPFEFSQAMTGFLLITTREGKLLYISDNVTEYLGHSMVDMLTQGDSLYDIIDKRDHAGVQGQLLQTSYNPCPDTGLDSRTFFCRMNVSRSFRRQAGFGDHKVMHVRGHFIQPLIRDHYGNQPVFMAICSPLITPEVKESATHASTLVFQSVHGLDMKYMEIAQNGIHHLGYSNSEILGKSWYDLLHPEDVIEAKEKHMQLIKSSHEMGCMLTVRLLTHQGDWVWVNMVMHIRQPFICDNGDPAIVCINQVISDSEADLFKMQSQLESSHIARSPEFLNPVQGSSPSHNIIQVPADTEQAMQSMGFLGLLAGTGTTYEAQVTFAPTSAEGGSGSPSQQQMSGIPTMQQGSGSLSDSSSDSTGSQSDSKQILRAKIFNKMNLKRVAAANSDPCKPAKMAKVSHSRSDRGSTGRTMGISGSVLVTSVPAGMNLGNQMSGGYGSTQVLAPMAAGQLFADLSLKKEVMLPESVAALTREFTQPLTPPTPAASDRSDSPGITTTTTGGLTVDTSGSALLPLGLLTPESSPTWETCTTILGSQTEQQVPTLHDLDEALQLAEAESEISVVSLLKPAEIKVEKTDVCNLPELDTIDLENYFASVNRNRSLAERKVEIKAEPLSPPQSSVGSPYSPAPSACDSYTESVASPGSNYASSVAMSPASQAMSPALSQCSNSVPSPLSPQQQQQQAEPQQPETADGLQDMSEAQLSSLVNSVTEAILDMVKQNGGNQGVSAATMATSMATSDMTGGFMLIPGRGAGSADELSVEVPDVEMVECPSAGGSPLSGVAAQGSPLPDPVAEAALINELHQLDQLASSAAPSYGNAAGLGSIFDETL